MIHRLDHLPVHDILQLFQIEDHARDRIGLAFQGDFHDIVMAVALWIRGSPVQVPVLLLAQFRHPAHMRSRKFHLARNQHTQVRKMIQDRRAIPKSREYSGYRKIVRGGVA